MTLELTFQQHVQAMKPGDFVEITKPETGARFVVVLLPLDEFDRIFRPFRATAKPETLVPWGKANPLAIPQQMQARVKRALDEGREVHVVACVIEKNESGNYVYATTGSPMKAEIMLMAAHQIQQKALAP